MRGLPCLSLGSCPAASSGNLRTNSHALLERLRRLVTGQPAASSALLDTAETAVDLMTTPVYTIPLDGSLNTALSLMMQHEVKRLPVVDGNGRLVGLLGRASLLRGLMDSD